MLHTQSRPNPSMLAAVIAKRNAATAGEPKTDVPVAQRRKPYTTQSEGYEVERVLPQAPEPEVEVVNVIPKPYAADVSEDEDNNGTPWMKTADELGLDWVPRLRRHTIIDPLDPIEEFDRPEFLGFHVVEW